MPDLYGNERRLLCVMPSIPLGGMERAVLRVVKALMARGFTSHFILDRVWGKEVQAAVSEIGSSWSGVRFVASTSRPRTWLEARLAARSLLRSPGELLGESQAFRPHQLLATSLNSAFMARRIARTTGVQSIFRVANPPGIARSRAKSTVDRLLWKTVYANYDALVCNSNYSAERVSAMVGDERRVHVIRNFLPEENFQGTSDAPELDRSKVNVVYLGQISRAKGADVLVEAALEVVAARDDIEFTLAGPDVWQDPLGDELRRRISSARASARVRLIGTIADVAGLMKQADIHVCPSVSPGESFPNVVLDAKQAGVPSVVFPTAGLPEAVTDGVDGVVTGVCDVLALRDALLALSGDPARRRRLAEGAVRSRRRHATSALTDAWIGLFLARP